MRKIFVLIIFLGSFDGRAHQEKCRPKGYLALLGPTPLRFQSALELMVEKVELKPLAMFDPAPVEPTNSEPAAPPAPMVVQTNVPAAQTSSVVQTNSAPIDQSQPVFDATNEKSVVTPQMFLRFFNTNAPGRETIISVPAKQAAPAQPPVSNSSSATYTSQ